jgi:tetratricopeptide (TPR) repeat protein
LLDFRRDRPRALIPDPMAPEIINRSVDWPSPGADSSPEGDLRRCQGAIAAAPDNALAYKNLGNALVALGNWAAAERAYRRALAIDGTLAAAAANLGHVFLKRRDWPGAIAAYRRALELDETLPKLWRLLGSALLEAQDPAGAIAALDRAIAADGSDEVARWLLGSARQGMGDFDGAVAIFEDAIARSPNRPEPYLGLAQAHFYAERFEAAIAAVQNGLKLDGLSTEQTVKLWVQLGVIDYEIADLDRAADCFERALALDPNHADAHWGRANIWLHRGDYQNGFREFEWRWPAVLPRREFAQPVWNGEFLGDRTLLVYTQCGLGDILHLARYLPLVAERCDRLWVEVPPVMVRLVGAIAGVDGVVAAGEPLPPFDVQISLLSVPKLLTPHQAAIPRTVPYLPVPAEVPAIAKAPGEFHIGIAWASGRQPSLDGQRDHRARSCPVADLVAALDHPAVRLHGLQVGPDRAALETLPPTVPIVDWGKTINDFADTAAIAQQLDLIVSVDTSVAHLAGGLGLETWLLLPHMPNWRWQLNRVDCPWYPTMALFRQEHRGDWSAPLGAIRTLLRRRLGEPSRDRGVTHG